MDTTSYNKKNPNCPTHVYIRPTDPNEVSNLIKSLVGKPSSGHDNVSNKLLKELHDSVLEPLCIIFNKSLSSGIFPDQMKIAEVVPLHKSRSREIPSNYRPISLLLTASKLLEIRMYIRTYNHLIMTLKTIEYNNNIMFVLQYVRLQLGCNIVLF